MSISQHLVEHSVLGVKVEPAITVGLTDVVYTWSELQTKHDTLVAKGGGTLLFVPNATYTVPAGQGVTIDVSLVGLQFNGAYINCSAWYGVDQASSTNGVVFSITATVMKHTFPSYTELRVIEGGCIYGSNTAAVTGDWGPTGFSFNKSYGDDPNHVGDSATPNCIIKNMRVIGLRRGMEYGSRAYFVRVQNSEISRNRAGIYTLANPEDFAERNTFSECVIAENWTAVDSTQAGQIYTFTNTSFDYNRQFFNLGQGARILMMNCHLEWNYGKNAGETLTPIAMTNADTAVHGRNLVIAYFDGVQNPFWDFFCTMDNSSQLFDIEVSKCYQIGRKVNTASFDAWVKVNGSASPMVRVKVDPQGVTVADVPAMTSVAEDFGSIGLLRSGASYPYIQINAVTSRTGTANALVSVNATENGVVQKNSKPMVKLQNGTPGSAAKYYINFPAKNFSARHAWTLFFNTQAMTGTCVVKEMVATAAATFNGTTVTWGLAPESPTYSNASGITLPVANDWKLHSWKDHATTFYSSFRLNPSAFVTLEIDMQNATGPLYISHIGFDVISNSN